ncbi:hypothetical protein Efla_000235 [Eimeria flavescens]
MTRGRCAALAAANVAVTGSLRRSHSTFRRNSQAFFLPERYSLCLLPLELETDITAHVLPQTPALQLLSVTGCTIVILCLPLRLLAAATAASLPSPATDSDSPRLMHAAAPAMQVLSMTGCTIVILCLPLRLLAAATAASLPSPATDSDSPRLMHAAASRHAAAGQSTDVKWRVARRLIVPRRCGVYRQQRQQLDAADASLRAALRIQRPVERGAPPLSFIASSLGRPGRGPMSSLSSVGGPQQASRLVEIRPFSNERGAPQPLQLSGLPKARGFFHSAPPAGGPPFPASSDPTAAYSSLSSTQDGGPPQHSSNSSSGNSSHYSSSSNSSSCSSSGRGTQLPRIHDLRVFERILHLSSGSGVGTPESGGVSFEASAMSGAAATAGRVVLLVLNQPLPRYFDRLLRNASLVVAADGAANHLLNVYRCAENQQQQQQQQPQKQQRQQQVEQEGEPVAEGVGSRQGQQKLEVTASSSSSGLSNAGIQTPRLPACICGDLDSSLTESLSFFQSRGVPILKMDDQETTDLEKTFSFAAKKFGFSEADLLLVVGAIGGRFDHSVASISFLFKILSSSSSSSNSNSSSSRSSMPQVVLLGGNNVCLLLQKGENEVLLTEKVFSSACALLPMGSEVKHVKSDGLFWNVKGESLRIGGLISSSNKVGSN